MMSRALRSIAQTPGLFLAATTSVAISLLLGGAFLLSANNARHWVSTLLGSGSVVVYLLPDVDQARADVIATSARALEGALSVTIETPEEAAAKLGGLLGENKSALAGTLGYSLLVQAQDAGLVPALAQQLKGIAGVDEVDYGEAVFDRVRALERLAGAAGAGLIVLVVLFCVFVVNMTVSLALYVRRDEIAIQKIVGAKNAFIIAPLVIESVLSGLLALVMAVLALMLLFQVFAARYASGLAALGLSAPEFFDARSLIVMASAAVLLSATGTLVAAMRYLRHAE